MMKFKSLQGLLIASAVALQVLSASAQPPVHGTSPNAVITHNIDLVALEEALKGPGVVGEVHGANPEFGLYVFTYRDPKNFFNFVHMSLISLDDGVRAVFRSLKRHDKVRVRGEFADNPSPQKHIDVKSIEVVERFENPYESDPHQYAAKIPDDLLNQESALFLVHAIGAEGKLLVVEYKDAILPIFVENRPELTKNLYRNDLVRLSYKLQKKPGRPQHLRLNDEVPDPVIVLESMLEKHGKPADVEGTLIMFPKSPQVSFNVFAVQELLPEGLSRQYTIVNFDSQSNLFTLLREKLQNSWDKFPGAWVNGRNKLVSTRLRVRVKGIFNEVDPNQANTQVIVSDLNDLQIFE